MDKRLENSFGVSDADMHYFHEEQPFSWIKMLTGNGAKDIKYVTYHYAKTSGQDLTLNFSPSAIKGVRPCLFVVHGGSWTRGNNSEIAAVNNYFANAGYQVATINYRLAPQFPSPAQQQDVMAAFTWLKQHAKTLQIDTNNFIFLGRSAGAQIVLTSAYTFNDADIKGVVAFYGANDMYWSYVHYDNPWIMDSRKVQRDFLGGTAQQVPDRYTAESPLLQVNSKSTPTLLVHGKLDAHVYFEQSVRLAGKLDSCKVPNVLLALPWATHGCEFNLNGPSGQLSMFSVERFCYAVTNNKVKKK